ncbi:hypothetical protein ACA910_008092 [Epithemia clementina (nom. ined.)]
MAKKRGRSDEKGAGRQKRPAKESDSSKKDENEIAGESQEEVGICSDRVSHKGKQDLSDLYELFQELVATYPAATAATSSFSSTAVRAIDQGWIRTRVGPQLLWLLEEQQSASVADSTTTSRPSNNNNNDDNDQFSWLCHLWALLLSQEGQSGRLTSGTNQHLKELEASSSAPPLLPCLFQTLCNESTASLVESFSQEEEQEEVTTKIMARMTTICHCMTLLGHEHETVWKCALQHHVDDDEKDELVGSVLMDFIPKNCRDLLEGQLKRSNLFVSLYHGSSTNMKDDTVMNDQTQKHQPFLVRAIETILKSLESTNDMVSNSNVQDSNGQEEQTSGRPSLQDNGSNSFHGLVETIFLHRSLEMLIDILASASSLRTFLLLYLQAIHFSIRCRRALVKRYGDNIVGGGGNIVSSQKLTKQLLERMEQLQHNDPLLLSLSGTNNNASNNKVKASTTTNAASSVLLGWSTSAQDTSTLRMHYYRRASVFQQICYRYYGGTSKLDDVIFAGLGQLCGDTSLTDDSNKFLRQALAGLTLDELLGLLHKLRLIDKNGGQPELDTLFQQRDFLLEVLQEYLKLPALSDHDPSMKQNAHSSRMPLFPTETLLWDLARIPPGHSQLLLPSQVLCLPKMYATQFLSFADYLWRNFTLLQLETASSIRSDLVNVIRRLRPVHGSRIHGDNDDDMIAVDSNDNATGTNAKTTFAGWARMALELEVQNSYAGGLVITKVEPPLLGELHPRKVLAEFTVDLQPCGAAIRQEWDSMGEHDNVFLVAIDANRAEGGVPPTVQELRAKIGYIDQGEEKYGDRLVPEDDDPSFPQRYGIQLVRGATIVHVRDQEGTILSDPAVRMDQQQQQKEIVGTKRVFSVSLDPLQYYMDAHSGKKNQYSSFNLVVRRHGRENSFKALLETTQNVLKGTDSIGNVLPIWLQPLLLGQGPTDAAHYQSTQMQDYAKHTAGVTKNDAFLDFGDTFFDEEHLRQAFTAGVQQSIVTVDGRSQSSCVSDKPPNETEAAAVRKNYKVRFTTTDPDSDGRPNALSIEAKSYARWQNHGGNPVRFTSKQVEAIRSGLSCGLTVVVGPPGTGKTDVAVQIISSLYHSFPAQRTVIVTHSNAALNDVFEKVMARGDVPERYMIRLGGGERDLQTESTHDFTKTGRVAYCLKMRAQLLEKVQQLSESMGLSGRAERGPDGSPSYTCESANIFYETKVKPKIADFHNAVSTNKADDLSEAELVLKFFPFLSNYSSIVERDVRPTSLNDVEKFLGRLRAVFDELSEYRPLEMLRSQRQRSEYFLIKQARIVAMTSTHAAIARSHLISLDFQYDNLVVEEAGQMTELDTFLPLLLQKGDTDTAPNRKSRLKRVCLMGDHNQLPPVIQNLPFARYSNMDQSMFARLIRMGVPRIELDQQGRTRPEIANLFNWRYNNLGNLDHVTASDRFKVANPGFVHTFQFINVENFQGKGETTPTAFFYQNIGEAEFVVALFQFMVLLGYPSRSISILTTYNGQKALISDILAQRCGEGTPLAGLRPHVVSTVDQYQGQQNDYILLSLVRTESVGHMRDVRRLVVALSRARYGLYVFGRFPLFANSAELSPIFTQFEEKCKSHCLQLLLNETYPTERQVMDGNEELPNDLLFEVEDVEHMGAMVHQMQQDLLQQMAHSG